MHGAQITSWGSAPIYTSLPPPPPPSPNETQVTLLAAGVHRVVRTRASGTHYTATSLPHTPGCDGVGRTADNKLVYIGPVLAQGTFAEVINVPNSQIFPLPEDADPIKVAALTNPALSSWMAIVSRCETLPTNFSVLVMGVTSASGRSAVGLAKSLGAGRVVGAARNAAAMETIEGLNEQIVLQDPVTETDFSKIGHVDVILDYLCGPPTEQLWRGMAKWERGKRTQWVQIGSLAGQEVQIPLNLLRSSDLVMRGSGQGSWSAQELIKDMTRLLEAVVKLDKVDFRIESLKDVEQAWSVQEDGRRVVFTP